MTIIAGDIIGIATGGVFEISSGTSTSTSTTTTSAAPPITLGHLYNIRVNVSRPTVTRGNYMEQSKAWATVASNVEARLQRRAKYLEDETRIYGRDALFSDYVLYCSPDVDIAANDRVIYGTRQFEVKGYDDNVNQMGVFQRVELLEIV